MATNSITICINTILIFYLLMASSLVSFGCKPSERKALLRFKHSLSFFNKTISSSWEGEDCCRWSRVSCDPTTGDVLKLQMDSIIETENLESSLQHLSELKHLEYLDLSNNDFNNSMPKALGSMHQLRYLNLSNIYLYGEVPNELGNLTHLQILDLSSSYAISRAWSNLNWVSSLQKLQYLGMSGTNLSRTNDWMKSLIGPLPSLRELRLKGCSLPTFNKTRLNSSFAALPIQYLDLSWNDMEGQIPIFIQNLTSLKHLDLSVNYLSSNVPLWLGKLHSLNYLSLTSNQLSGKIPTSLGLLSALEILDLSNNQLSGKIPSSLGNLFFLKQLSLSFNNLSHISSSLEFPATLEQIDLSSNQLTGQIPAKLFGQLSKLQSLDISFNYFLEGTVLSETHFANLINLTALSIGRKSDPFITLDLSFDWMPPFQLEKFYASNCKINGPFPQWLKTQKSLTELDLSNASISGPIPKWFHTMELLSYVDLSYNKITGSPVFPFNFTSVDLSNNALSSLFILHDNHTMYPSAVSVDLYNNFIHGKLPGDLHHIMPSLQNLAVSNNHIYGPIPKSLCHLTNLETLNLEKNNLSGSIPDCLGKLAKLEILSLSSNKLSGEVPCFGSSHDEINRGSFGLHLHLNDNSLTGQIPSCLGNSTRLRNLDVGGNELSGKVPKWLNGDSLPNMRILRLRDNKLSGFIPHEVCSLPSLRILDFGHNLLTGTIPHCLGNLTAMNWSPPITPPDKRRFMGREYIEKDNINEVIHGIGREYITKTLKYLVNIDLSCNKLVGSIPNEITNLSCLLGLNLSYNQLSGQIPRNIGGLRSLLSLDLSRNRFWGTIPTSMGAIYSLESLDVSYNNLSGPIPTGNQLQTLINPSIYAGNPYLCGDPLPRKCKNNHESPDGSGDQGKQGAEDKDKHETVLWFYLVVMSGFATGFWVVVGTLVVKKSWRYALFRRVDDAQDWLYVAIVVRMSKFKN